MKATCSEDGEGRRTFSLQTDVNLLESKINQLDGDVLVIIDPSSAYMGSKIDSHKNAEVRGVLAPIGEMAERTGAAVLSVTHLSKGNAGKDAKAIDRVIGSVAFTAAPRAGFLVTEDPHDKDRRLFLHIKNNLARSPQGLAFRLGQRMVGESQNMSIGVGPGPQIQHPKEDPLVLRFERLAFAPSELAGIAETGRARVEV